MYQWTDRTSIRVSIHKQSAIENPSKPHQCGPQIRSLSLVLADIQDPSETVTPLIFFSSLDYRRDL